MRALPARWANRPAAVVDVDQSNAERDYVWILHRCVDGTIGIQTVNAASVEIVPLVYEAGAIEILLGLEDREVKEGAK